MTQEAAPGRRRDLQADASRGQRCGGKSAAGGLESLPDTSSESHWLWFEPRKVMESEHGSLTDWRLGLGF